MEKLKPQTNYQSRTGQIISLEKGKIPPQAIDLEEVVIGALMIDQKGITEVLHLLNADVFYKQSHQHIFEAIREVYLKGDAVDLLTISDQLEVNGTLELSGGQFYLIQLTQKVSSSAHIEYHTRIILQKYIQRRLIKSANKIIEKSYMPDVDVFDLLDDAYNELNDVSEVSVKPQEAHIGTLMEPQITKGEQIYRQEIKPGIETPIKKLTRKSGGWRDDELIILAARPGMGKTALAVSYALHAAKMGIPTAFFSLEMSKEQLTNRIISMEARIDNQKFTLHGLNDDDAKRSREAKLMLEKIPFYIDDTAALSIEQFQIKAKRMASRYGIKFFVLDYLQLMTGSSSKSKGNREQEVSNISRGLKLVAKTLHVPMMALSQLSRAVETRGGSKRPLLSDLRESGAIEQDADVVHFIYRPEYYKIDQWDDEYNREPTYNEAEYIIAKNRNGGLVRNRMKFEKEFTLFSDLEEIYEEVFFEKELPKHIPASQDYSTPIEEEEDDLPF
ncbi:MAG: replicative DNA helicase [Aequorivita sp.]|nr:replicative DNA helicase [Aequorivita sp.]